MLSIKSNNCKHNIFVELFVLSEASSVVSFCPNAIKQFIIKLHYSWKDTFPCLQGFLVGDFFFRWVSLFDASIWLTKFWSFTENSLEAWKEIWDAIMVDGNFFFVGLNLTRGRIKVIWFFCIFFIENKYEFIWDSNMKDMKKRKIEILHL